MGHHGRAQARRDMSVMPTGVHDAGVDGAIGNRCDLGDRQRIHVCSQGHDGTAALPPVQYADNPGAPHAFPDTIQSQGCQDAGDRFLRPVFLESQFGMLMNVASDRYQGFLQLSGHSRNVRVRAHGI